ncbi:hypothetical protein GCM10009678_10370 [Actinomadura kijaniata]|uniref:DUF6458 domain-containing protein n=1 Tax=Actinomadura namibiensis TaxID=182080 RepID=A0A7W3LJH7_ACTNM|nr:DUF6458 family protein [Actinomadura namibiensis]MBA8949223.1 hypothetical protein [Actinomadura namibiensis]
MTIGGSIALIIIGAILAYAVEFDISGLDIRVVGFILMVGGLVGLVIGVARIASARRRTAVPPAAVREEYYEEPPARRPRY